MNLKLEALTAFYEYSEECYQKFNLEDSTRILLYYGGDLNFGFANALSSRLERILESELSNKQAQKRFFSVFVEAIQNIRIHGCADTEGKVHASILVFVKNGKINGQLANVVSNAQGKLLKRRYDEVNSMELPDLKRKYLEIMKDGDMSEKGGAGLGIITIVLRSKNKSDYRLIPLTDIQDIFESHISVDLL